MRSNEKKKNIWNEIRNIINHKIYKNKVTERVLMRNNWETKLRNRFSRPVRTLIIFYLLN